MIVKYFVRSDVLPEVLDCLERPVEGGVEPGALVLGPGLPVVAAQQLQVESPGGVDLLLNIWSVLLLLMLCSASSVPQPVVQSRRRPLLGPSPG